MAELDIEAAREQINAARAQTYDNIAVTQAHVAQVGKSAEEVAADRAAIAALVQQTVTVDTSVGTRVFAGGTMIYGDTGWRDITGLLTGGVLEASDGTMKIHMRRVNETIHIVFRLRVLLNTSLDFLELPPGFIPHLAYRTLGSSSVSVIGNFGFPNRLRFTPSPTAGGVVSANLTFGASTTYANTWPTSLPGTAA